MLDKPCAHPQRFYVVKVTLRYSALQLGEPQMWISIPTVTEIGSSGKKLEPLTAK
jgi:hypothetical protein